MLKKSVRASDQKSAALEELLLLSKGKHKKIPGAASHVGSGKSADAPLAAACIDLLYGSPQHTNADPLGRCLYKLLVGSLFAS